MNIDISLIQDHPRNARLIAATSEQDAALADSIAALGLLQPTLVADQPW